MDNADDWDNMILSDGSRLGDPTEEQGDLYTVKDLCDKTGLSSPWVYKIIQKTSPSIKKTEGRLRFYDQKFLEALKNGCAPYVLEKPKVVSVEKFEELQEKYTELVNKFGVLEERFQIFDKRFQTLEDTQSAFQTKTTRAVRYIKTRLC